MDGRAERSDAGGAGSSDGTTEGGGADPRADGGDVDHVAGFGGRPVLLSQTGREAEPGGVVRARGAGWGGSGTAGSQYARREGAGDAGVVGAEPGRVAAGVRDLSRGGRERGVSPVGRF